MYQDNVGGFYKMFLSDKDFNIKCLKLLFLEELYDFDIYENSNKIVNQKSLLSKFIELDNLELPVYLRINDSSLIYGVVDYFK